jgi:hypothetical protein
MFDALGNSEHLEPESGSRVLTCKQLKDPRRPRSPSVRDVYFRYE